MYVVYKYKIINILCPFGIYFDYLYMAINDIIDLTDHSQIIMLANIVHNLGLYISTFNMLHLLYVTVTTVTVFKVQNEATINPIFSC